MLTTTSIFLLATAGHLAAAEPLAPPFAFSLVEPTAAPLVRRDIDYSCASSLTSTDLAPPEPTDSDLAAWQTSAADDFLATGFLDDVDDLCQFTAPLSLSSAMVSYAKVMSEWAATFEDVVDAITTKCGYDTLGVTMTNPCSAGETVVFTAEPDRSSDRVTETLAEVTFPTETIYVEGAAGKHFAGATGAFVVGLCGLLLW
jgi:hypothetical protein